jgi:hypothetical protein
MQSSHLMILNSTKFGGNRTKDVEVGPDRRTDRQTDRPDRQARQTGQFLYTPQTMFAGGIIIKRYKIQYALCHRKFSYMINQKFMKLCTLQDPNMKMCTYVGYPPIPIYPPNYVCWGYNYQTV